MFGQQVKDVEPLEQLRCLIVTSSLMPSQQLPLSQLEAILHTMPVEQAVLHQGGAMSVHEFQYYMTSLASFGLATPFPPLVMECFCDSLSLANQWIHGCPQGELTATALLWQHHWIPVLVRKSHTVLFITTEEGKQVLQILFPSNFAQVEVRPALHSSFRNDCGFQAVAWIVAHASVLEGSSLSTYDAIKWRSLYWQHVFHNKPHITFHLGGHGDVEIAVQALLKEHGVPIEALKDRATAVLHQLGISAVQGVFQAARPWQALKTLANSHQPPMRLITHAELQAVISSRTKTGKAVGTKQNKKKPVAQPFQLSTQEIHLPPGIFCQEDGEVLSQLEDRQFGPHAKGMALFNEEEYRPYRNQGCLSDQGLGFLVVSPFSQETAAQGSVLRFPVQSTVTGEPILTSAVLIQKGKVEVKRNMPSQPHTIEQVDTQTVKVHLFRDQCPVAWDKVCQQPVRHLLELIGGLKVCKQEGCTCPGWHPASKGVDQPILDVWQRDFVTLHFRKSRPEDSAVFVVHMRLAKDAFLHCFRVSGTQGVYIEPRSQDGKTQDAKFQTVWLQRQSIAEAKAMQAVVPAQSALLRINQRYGLKVPTPDAPAVHAKVKPDEPYMSGLCHTFKVGPMPWGTTKKAMQGLLTQWGWKAKVLHSAGKSADATGLMWTISSTDLPPCTAYQLAHGDVIIHQESSDAHQPWQPPRVQVSPSLLKLKNQVDPMMINGDPWAESAKNLPSVKMAESVNAKFASWEATIDQRIQEKIHNAMPDDVAMASDQEPRLAAMEQQIAQLQAQSSKMEHKVDHLHRQVELQGTAFSNALDAKLSDQMAKIEALMAKRSRTE
eukprot:s797_g28.t1